MLELVGGTWHKQGYQSCENRPLFIDIFTGSRRIWLPEWFVLNGTKRNWPLYFLADEIYSEWSVFVKLLSARTIDKERYFAERKTSICKDVERVFCVLQERFKILRHESFEWSDSMTILINYVCVFVHEMVFDIQRRGEIFAEIDRN